MLPLEKQVTSLEISKCLKELGVKQESLYRYYTTRYKELLGDPELSPSGATLEGIYPENYSAYTASELGEIIPYPHHTTRGEKDWRCSAYIPDKDYNSNGNTEADARGKMLIYLLENKLLSL